MVNGCLLNEEMITKVTDRLDMIIKILKDLQDTTGSNDLIDPIKKTTIFKPNDIAIVKEFVNEVLIIDSAEVSPRFAVYESYQLYCQSRHIKALDSLGFDEIMGKLGYTLQQSGRGHIWIGLLNSRRRSRRVKRPILHLKNRV